MAITGSKAEEVINNVNRHIKDEKFQVDFRIVRDLTCVLKSLAFLSKTLPTALFQYER